MIVESRTVKVKPFCEQAAADFIKETMAEYGFPNVRRIYRTISGPHNVVYHEYEFTGEMKHLALVVADQVDGEVLDIELRIVLQALAIQRVQDRVAGAVRGRAGTRRLVAAEVLALAAEGALVDAAVVEARERHAEMLQLVDRLRRGAAHVQAPGRVPPQVTRRSCSRASSTLATSMLARVKLRNTASNRDER